ncbi:MAG: hypothetical protein PHV55_08650 [Candidatus Omnitrophica bacterium]|nr:hypothetical protein [Candidatus Omnitrophota bacterium]
MKKIFLVLIGVFLLIVSGCRQDDFSRYPSVTLPQFSSQDYYNLLSDKNPQVVYNAVVNLGGRAVGFGEKLSDEKADKSSAEYILAGKVYKKIAGLLDARDPYTVAASLRFLQIFSEKYGAKTELLEPVLKVKSNNPHVLCEQILALSLIADKSSGIPDSTLRGFLNDPSWIVSHSAYRLIDRLENDRLRQELIVRCKNIGDEKEKLLILTAFGNKPGDAAADFFFSEIVATESIKIRCALYDILGNCENQEKVLAWVSQNYEKIIAADGKYLFARHVRTLEDNFSSKLLVIFLNKGFIAEKGFLESLDEKLEKYTVEEPVKQEDKEKLNNIKIVEEALLSGKAMAADWKSLRDKKAALNAELAGLQAEYDILTKEFSVKVEDLLRIHGVSEEKIKEYLTGIAGSREILPELLTPEETEKAHGS